MNIKVTFGFQSKNEDTQFTAVTIYGIAICVTIANGFLTFTTANMCECCRICTYRKCRNFIPVGQQITNANTSVQLPSFPNSLDAKTVLHFGHLDQEFHCQFFNY